jgi:transposase
MTGTVTTKDENIAQRMNHGYSPMVLHPYKTQKRRTAMVQNNDNGIVHVVHPICCGLDVHKEKISACLIISSVFGGQRVEVEEFGTFTDDLIRMRSWLSEHDCPIVAMESTGIYWRPVHNVLEGYMEVILVNARHIKNVPGRKTDISDSKWLASLLRHGLLKGSFIPPGEVREWRDLTRLRRTYVESLGDYKRRTHKLFESANIKIDSVVSDLFGVTARNLMKLLAQGPSEISLEQLESCLRGKLKAKREELFRSIQGFFTDHHRYLLSSLLRTIAGIEREIEAIIDRLRKVMQTREPLLEKIMEVTGISEVSARAILSETGPTMDPFRTSAAICSWSGLCPGNNESAGKRHSGKSPVRKHHLKTIMIEVAWAAVKTKGSYYRAKYYRLKARRGARRAIVAIAHRLLKAVYHIIRDGVSFRDLGEEHLNQDHKQARLKRLNRQAQKLGYQLVLQA